MTIDQLMDVPMCRLQDLIAIDQIKTEGFKYKEDNDAELERIFSLK